MASLALSVVGTAIGGPIGGAIGGMVGGMIDNMLFPTPKPPKPLITTSTYGDAIPLAYGPENRLGVNMIWSDGFQDESKSDAKLHLGKSAKNVTTYQTDIALAVGAGPWQPSWLQKIWANGTNIFDASVATSHPTPDGNGVVTWDLSHKSHSMFDTVTVYPGNNLQLPDPTIESRLGMGEVPAYRGTAYIVITGFQLTAFGNGIPLLNVLAAAQPSITIAEIAVDICTRCGIDPLTVSTSSLTTAVSGYNITSQTDGASGLQPLSLVYNFDVAEVCGGLRMVPRGREPICTVSNDQLAGHAYGDQQPSAYEWPRAPEYTLPKMASLTFIDPSRDLQQNTQAAERGTGSSQSNISYTVNLTLASSVAAATCDRMLWETQIGKQSLNAATDDRLIWLEGARTYAVESPAGYESVRITKRTRGTNGVIEIEGKRDYSALYFSTAPGSTAAIASNVLSIGGPVNPPIFVELPMSFPGVSQPTMAIAVSGGDGTTASPAWNGCSVYAATSDDTADYALIGVIASPACMGKLTASLASFSGSNPDSTHTLAIDTSMSDGSPNSMTVTDANAGLQPYWVNGELLTATTVTDLGDFQFHLTNLYRRLYSTDSGSHASGSVIARIDQTCLFFPLPAAYVGKSLFFRFVGGGETLAGVTTYEYTVNGSGYVYGNEYTATFLVEDIATAATSSTIATFVSGQAWTLPATTDNPASSVGGSVGGAPSADTTFDIKLSGSTIATVTITMGSTTNFTLTDALAEAIASGATLDLVSPSSLNSMTGTLSIVLRGTL